MDNTTMTMNAVSCVLSVRLRPTTGQVRLAATLAPEQGTTVSVAAFMGGRVADFRAPITGRRLGHRPHVRPRLQDPRCRSLPLWEAPGLTQTRSLTSRPRTRHHRVRGLRVSPARPIAAPHARTDTARRAPDRVPDRSGTQNDSSDAEQQDRDAHHRCGPSDQTRHE